MSSFDFTRFRADAQARGFDEIVERRWEPLAEASTHAHPFSVEALVVAGEMWLTVGDATQHLKTGDTFSLGRDIPHAERYGDAGATYWAARRS